MSERCRGLDPFQPVILELQLAKDGREHTHGMDGCADVVMKAGQCEFGCATATTDFLVGLQYEDGFAGASEKNGGGEPIRPCAHDHCIITFALTNQTRFSRPLYMYAKGGPGQ